MNRVYMDVSSGRRVKKKLSITAIHMLERIKDPLRYYFYTGPNPKGALRELLNAGLITDRLRVTQVRRCWVPAGSVCRHVERFPK